MSEEEARKIIDKIKQEEFPYALAIAKAYEKLQQENKHLKEKLDIADTNYDIIYDYFSKVNELLGTELCEEVLDKISKLKQENKELNNILIEFEKWLEENYCLYIPEVKQNSAIGKVYDKLQELKEGK